MTRTAKTICFLFTLESASGRSFRALFELDAVAPTTDRKRSRRLGPAKKIVLEIEDRIVHVNAILTVAIGGEETLGRGAAEKEMAQQRDSIRLIDDAVPVDLTTQKRNARSNGDGYETEVVGRKRGKASSIAGGSRLARATEAAGFVGRIPCATNVLEL